MREVKQEPKVDKGNRCPESSGRTEKNLRAINRAPEIVADLYRDGLINQVDAARLGKKDSDKSVIASRTRTRGGTSFFYIIKGIQLRLHLARAREVEPFRNG